MFSLLLKELIFYFLFMKYLNLMGVQCQIVLRKLSHIPPQISIQYIVTNEKFLWLRVVGSIRLFNPYYISLSFLTHKLVFTDR